MAKLKTHNILLNSKIAVGIGLAMILVLAFALVAQGFIETRNYREQIVKALEEHTHRTVSIKGDVKLTLLPIPTLYVPGLEMRDPESKRPTPEVSADMVEIHVNLLSLLSDSPKIFDITLQHPVLELVRTEGNVVHWDWLNPALFKGLMSNVATDKSMVLQLHNGVVVYHDSVSDTNVVFEKIDARFTNGDRFGGSGNFTCYGYDVHFTTTRDEAPEGSMNAPFELNLAYGSTDSIEIKGTMDISKEIPELKGDLTLELADASMWMHPKREGEQKLFDSITKQAGQSNDHIAYPLKIKSNWEQTGLTVHMTNAQVVALSSSAAAKLDLTWDGWHPKVALDMAFDLLDLDRWRKPLMSMLTLRGGSDFYSKSFHSTTGKEEQTPLTQNVDLTLNVVADKVVYGAQTWRHGKLSSVFADAAITVNQLSIDLPGETSLALFGVVTPSTTNDLRFEGTMETKGKSLREVLTVFDESASGLPEIGLGNFSARSNIFISSEQLRLSDADVKLADLHLNGGLVAYFDNAVRLEAQVQLKDINFDYFRNVWRERQQQVHDEDFFLKFSRKMDFNWLKKLQATVDLRIAVNNFTFLDRSGESASFRLYARSGQFGIYDINFVYPSDAMKGSFLLNIVGDQPTIDLGLSMGALDTAYFNPEPFTRETPVAPAAVPAPAPESTPQSHLVPTQKGKQLAQLGNVEYRIEPQSERIQLTQDVPSPPKEATTVFDYVKKSKADDLAADPNAPHWSQDLLDMSWMIGLGGNVTLNVGRLYYKNYHFDNFMLQSKFSNNVMVFNKLSFLYWGGECNVTGTLYGGKVPAANINVSMARLNMHDVLKDLVDRNNIEGSVSVNAAFNTSGVNMLSWIEQLEGKIVVVGRGVKVKGINLPAVVDAVSVSRTASDVVSSVNTRLLSGTTEFSVDGNVNIKNGVMRTPGFSLKTGAIIGDMVGQVNLLTWKMDFSSLFQFPELSSETVPTLSIQLYGPLKNGEMRTDTASLEAFVAKRIISK